MEQTFKQQIKEFNFHKKYGIETIIKKPKAKKGQGKKNEVFAIVYQVGENIKTRRVIDRGLYSLLVYKMKEIKKGPTSQIPHYKIVPIVDAT